MPKVDQVQVQYKNLPRRLGRTLYVCLRQAISQQILSGQEEIKRRLKRLESFISRLSSQKMFEALSDWGQEFAERKGITKSQVLKDD